MGLDWLAGQRPKEGHEERFWALFEQLEAQEAQDEAMMAEWQALGVPAWQCVGAPVVGQDTAADAVFTTAFARRGLIAEHGISWLLPALVGHANALDLLLSARKLNAGEAHRIGLVNHLAAADALMDQVMAYARDLADNVSPRSIRVMKRQVYRAVQQSLEDAILIGNAEMPGSFASEDFREGVAHFVEKRPARFSGR